MALADDRGAPKPDRPPPLDGVRVLDLSRYIAGPFAAMILGDMGADVIKVERPRGEDSRGLGPFTPDGTSLYFTSYNRNKRSLAIDLRTDQGRAILWDLVRVSDVLIENFRPGTLADIGMDYPRLSDANPRLVLASISGFGQSGPYAERLAFDSIAQAMSGLMSLTGPADGPPLLVGTYAADFSAALYAALGITFALYECRRTGRGQVLDLALVDSLVSILATAIPEYLATGQVQARSGNRDRVSGPANAYPAQDGWVYLHAGTDALFPRLCTAMGQPELVQDARFRNVAARMAHIEQVDRRVGEWVGQHTVAQVVEAGARAGFPCSEVAFMPDVVHNPQLLEREQVIQVEYAGAGRVPMTGSPLRLSATPACVRRPPPMLGEHSRQVVCELLGKTDDEYGELLSRGVLVETRTASPADPAGANRQRRQSDARNQP